MSEDLLQNAEVLKDCPCNTCGHRVVRRNAGGVIEYREFCSAGHWSGFMGMVRNDMVPIYCADYKKAK